MHLLAQSVVLLLAAVIAVPLFQRLKLSSTLGYLAAGVALGPFGLRAIEDVDGTREVAELGIALLLFVIGLELRPARLAVMRRPMLRLGAPQLAVTTATFTALGLALGLPGPAAFLTGFSLSLSSTPLVLQLLAERGQLQTPEGRAAFAVLLLQDVAVMPMLAVLPLLGADAGEQPLGQTLLGGARALGLLALLVVGGRYALRPLLRTIARTAIPELFTAAALLVVTGTALLAAQAGLSTALGAFVAGLLLADSEYRHELEADIQPFKGLLLGLFFIAVGASANLGLLAEQPQRIGALALGVLGVKALLMAAIARAGGHPPSLARGLALSLAQAGEFGFVLLSLGVARGVMEEPTAQALVLAATVSMALSPPLLRLHTALAERSRAAEPERFESPPDGARVLIGGFGRMGQIVGRVLRGRGIPFTALDGSAAQVEVMRRFGHSVYYGDASRLELLEAAGARRAEVLVLAMPDIEISVRTAQLVQRHFPQLRVLARAHNRQHALRLLELGVDCVVRDTYLSSLELSQQTLQALAIPPSEAARTIHTFRTHDEALLAEQLALRDDEQKLVQTAELAARELERLLRADAERTAQS
jgi:monovalent cation:proton antiporter-2 (CPA2) family protein